MKFLQSFWTYLVTERLGYHRPIPTVHDDHALRLRELARVARLEASVRYLDLHRDLLRHQSRFGE